MKTYQPRLRVVVPERVRILIDSRTYLSFPVIVLLVLAAGVAGAVHPQVALCLIAGAPLAWILWVRPKWVFFAFLVLLPFSIEVPLGRTAKIDLPTEALIPLVLLVVLARSSVRGKATCLASRLWLPVILFAVYLPVGLPGTRFPLISAKAIVRDWTHIAGGFVLPLLLIRGRNEVKVLLLCILGSSAILVTYGVFTQLRQSIAIYQTIASPFFQEHSIYAAFLCFLLVMTLGLVLSGYARSVGVRFGYVPLLALALGLTFVRGAWLALGAGGLTGLWIERRRVPLALLAAGLAAVLVLIAASTTLGITGLFAERLQHFADPSYVTNLDRLDRWGSARMIWREHPILGAGWGTFAEEYFDHVYIRRAFSTDQRMGAHSLYLEILADGGIVALILFLVVLGCFYAEGARVLRKVRGDGLAEGLCVGALAAVTAHLFHAMVNNLGPSDKVGVLFWFGLALVPIAEHLWQNRQQPHGHAVPGAAD